MRGRPWSPEAAEILRRMVPGGYTDAEIIEHIQRRTGVEYTRRTLIRERAAQQLGNCWQALNGRTNRRRASTA